jgi:predicted nucleic acid-binding protein
MIVNSGLYVLDTRLVAHIARGDNIGAEADRRFALRTRPERPLISVTTVAEIRRTAATIGRGWTSEQAAQLEALLAEFDWVSLDSRTVQDAYVRIGSTLDNMLESLPDKKLWVAAVAAATQATLLTYDTDYQRVPSDLLTLGFVAKAELERLGEEEDLALPLE